MGFADQLEDFAAAERGRDPVQARRLSAERERGREAGYAEGFEAGLAEAAAADREAVAALRESLADAALTQAAMREEALAALRSLVAAMVATVAPSVAAAALPSVVGDIVAARAVAGGSRAVTVVAAPAVAPALRETLAGVAEVGVDPAPDAPTARIDWGDGGAAIDVDAALRDIDRAVARIFATTDEESSNVG